MSQNRNIVGNFARVRLTRQPTHSNDAATKLYVDNNAGGGGIVKVATKTEVSNTEGTLLTPANLLSGYIHRTSSDDQTSISDRFPTASSLVNAISGVTVGSYFDFMILCKASQGMDFDLNDQTTDGFRFRGDESVGSNEMRIFRVLIERIEVGDEFYHIFQYDN